VGEWSKLDCTLVADELVSRIFEAWGASLADG